MRILKTIREVRATVRALRRNEKSIGLVPTMGALHDGHLSLVRSARGQCGATVVSIFVNPIQFGPREDLTRYPRPLARDCELLKAENVDIVFTPGVEEMYPPGAMTFVTVDGISERLEGAVRPGHFRGVATVCAKLFHAVEPDVAFFGQKDAQQVAVISKMVRELDFPLEITVCPIVREADGLAMSSRNVYLDPTERKQALVLHRALMRVQALCDQGEGQSEKLIAAAKSVFAEVPEAHLDYFEILDPMSFEPVADAAKGALVVTAAKIGATRLLDNLTLYGPGKSGHAC